MAGRVIEEEAMSAMMEQDDKDLLAAAQAAVAGVGQPCRSGRQPWKCPEVADVDVAEVTRVSSNIGLDSSDLS